MTRTLTAVERRAAAEITRAYLARRRRWRVRAALVALGVFAGAGVELALLGAWLLRGGA